MIFVGIVSASISVPSITAGGRAATGDIAWGLARPGRHPLPLKREDSVQILWRIITKSLDIHRAEVLIVDVLGHFSGGSQALVMSSSRRLTSRNPHSISHGAGGLPTLPGSLKNKLLRGN